MQLSKTQKEILQYQLNNEKAIIEQLKHTYGQAQDDCVNKIIDLMNRDDFENWQSIVYQKKYQEMIKGQLDTILEKLQSNQYETIAQYLNDCYYNGFISTMYDLNNQGIPLVLPINQKQVLQAISTNSKLSKSLYESLGENIADMKQKVVAEVSRGFANNATYAQIAKNISGRSNAGINNSIRIARTEGQRIQNTARYNAQTKAKSKGADVLKQWCSTLDGRTRDSHRLLDGKIVEVDDEFKIPGASAMYPGDFGDPAEDCNCRCCILQRARWALDEDELEELESRAEYYDLDKSKDIDDFKEKYLKAAEKESVRSSEQKMNSVEDIKEKINENNETLEKLQVDLHETHKKLENSMLFGTGDSNELRTQYDSIKAQIETITNNNKELKNMIPIEERTVQSTKIIDGRNMMGDIDYSSSKFDYDIETAINAQGFDGNPTILEYDEFKEAMEKSNFYAERTYSATSQEILDEYQNQLYNGKWYVDCSEGGAQYGKGMYCAASYDLKDNISMGGIGTEMSGYKVLNQGKGAVFSNTEAITLQPGSKILELPNGAKAGEYISDMYQIEWMKKNAPHEMQYAIEEYAKASNAILKLSGNDGKEVWDAAYDARDAARNALPSHLFKDSMDSMQYKIEGEKYGKLKDPGTLAVEMGYDAINAIGHGESGSYTVILNRTKVIFCEGGSIYGN